MSSEPLYVVIGSGPGIGRSTAALFASKGFGRVCLLARSQAKLDDDEKAVKAAAKAAGKEVKVTTHSIDITNLSALKQELRALEDEGHLECVHFNAARVEPSKLLEAPVEDIEQDFAVTSLALYRVGQWAIPILQKNKDSSKTGGPSFIVTSGLIYDEPIPELFILCMMKSAQRSLTLSLQKTFGHEVHVALAYVGGAVAPENKVLNPDNIADKIWGLHTQKKSEWTRDITLVEEA